MFEDNSCWLGQWENDQPVEASSKKAFAALGACPQIYIDDLLRNELDGSMACKGIESYTLTPAFQMCMCCMGQKCPCRSCIDYSSKHVNKRQAAVASATSA